MNRAQKSTVAGIILAAMMTACGGGGGGGDATPAPSPLPGATATGTTTSTATVSPVTPVETPVYQTLNEATISTKAGGVGQPAIFTLIGNLSPADSTSLEWKIIQTPSGTASVAITSTANRMEGSFTPSERGVYRISLKSAVSERIISLSSYNEVAFDSTKAKVFSAGATLEVAGGIIQNQHSISTDLTDTQFETVVKKYPLLKTLGRVSRYSWYIEKTNESIAATEQLELLKLEKQVRYIGNRLIVGSSAINASFVPGDGSAFNDGGGNWHLEDMKMTDVWGITRGALDVAIGVIDGGFDARHVKLQARLARVIGSDTTDKNVSHGNAVASVIAAKQDNEQGVSGINAASTVYADTFLNGITQEATVARLFNENPSIKVINNSWGNSTPTFEIARLYADERRYAAEKHQNVLHIYAAGNNGDDARVSGGAVNTLGSAASAQMSKLANVVVVAAYNKNRRLARYSNYSVKQGTEVFDTVDIAAPTDVKAAALVTGTGTALVSTYFTEASADQYGVDKPIPTDDKNFDYGGGFNGTSAAAPMVTGVASLIFSVYPRFTAAEVKDILISTASEFITHRETGNGAIEPLDVPIPIMNPLAAVTKAKKIADGLAVQATAIVADPFSASVKVNVKASEGGLVSASGTISASDTGCLGATNTSKTFIKTFTVDATGSGIAPLGLAGVQCYSITGNAKVKDASGVVREHDFAIFKQIVSTRITAKDQVTLAPVAAATVTMDGFAGSLFTNASGQATVYLEPNFHKIFVNKQFYKESAQMALINCGYVEVSQGVLEVAAYLTQDTVKTIGALSGLVTDSAGAPVKNATVRVSGGVQTNGYFASATTDALGRYNLSNLSKTDSSGAAIPAFSMLVSATGYTKVSRDNVVVLDGKTRAENFSLVPGTDTSVVTAYTTSFEGTTSWLLSGLWNLPSIAENTRFNAFVDTGYVALAPDEGTPKAYLPKARDGASVLWYGQPANGSFIGTQSASDFLRSGGTSVTSNSGKATSPIINLVGVSNPALTFWTWWEIESVNPNSSGYDLMDVEISTDNGVNWVRLKRLNPFVDPNDTDKKPKPFSSGGFNRKPVWVNESINLSAYAGKQVRLRFAFDTVDKYYNAFRGWMIDDLRITGI